MHSRFTLKDREMIEQCIDEVQLVGTQAIEVSLDIDFDVLYTEPAPLDALISDLEGLTGRDIRVYRQFIFFPKHQKQTKSI